jgi:hypothetical protein
LNKLGDRLKEGSYKEGDSWITFVNVLDAKIFNYCLQCKAEETQKAWDEIGGYPSGI